MHAALSFPFSLSPLSHMHARDHATTAPDIKWGLVLEHATGLSRFVCQKIRVGLPQSNPDGAAPDAIWSLRLEMLLDKPTKNRNIAHVLVV